MVSFFRRQIISNHLKSFSIINRQNFKKHYKSASACISRLFKNCFNIKSNFFLLKDKLIGDWNFFAYSIFHCNYIQDNSRRNDILLDKIYKRLVTYVSTLETINRNAINSYIENEEKYTARYYASYLWSWSKNTRIDTSKICKFIQLTLDRMKCKDIDFILSVITYLYDKYFPHLNSISTKEDLVEDVLSKLEQFKIYSVVINVIHIWFMSMPLVEELSKHIEWEKLRSYNAFLLDEDRLYSILLLMTYKDHQPN